jgi:hypothetical protein
MGIFSWELTLEGRSIRVYPGVSELPGVSEFTPDTPGLKASTTIFWVKGYKSPLHSFIYSSLLLFRPEHLQTSFTPSLTPFGTSLVKFVVEI